jgi:hypothetical protein
MHRPFYPKKDKLDSKEKGRSRYECALSPTCSQSCASVRFEDAVEQGLRALIVVDHERDVLDRRLRVLGEELANAGGHLADRLIDALFHGAEHDAHADRRKRDLGEAGVGRRFEAIVDDLAERPLQIVDDEHDVLERALEDMAVAFRDNRLAVLERHCLARLRMEGITGNTTDDAVDTAEPHPAGVDGRDERICTDTGNIAGNCFHHCHDDTTFL